MSLKQACYTYILVWMDIAFFVSVVQCAGFKHIASIATP